MLRGSVGRGLIVLTGLVVVLSIVELVSALLKR
jgi:hypothetical protein